MILAISEPADEHATAVLRQLERDGVDARLLDLSAFPQDLAVAMAYDRTDGAEALRCSFGETALDAFGAVWWRRPQPFELSPELQRDVDRSFAYTECRSALDGLWRTLDAFWVNDPTRDDDAARKPYQLRVAQQVGFEIPRTLITNDPERAGSFVDEHGPERTVYKAFSGTERAWRETRVFRENETELLDAVRHAPVIFQEYVPAAVDLRVTVMGDRVFPAAIHSQETDYPVDYRMTIDSARVEPTRLPDPVVERIRDYVDRLGLVYGAIDMRRTPDGRYVFLEINPSGQWLFVEERTGQPMTETFARLLARGDSGAGSRGDTESGAAVRPTATDAVEPTAGPMCSGPGRGAAAGTTRDDCVADSTDQEPKPPASDPDSTEQEPQPRDSDRERGRQRDSTTGPPSS